MRDIVEQLSQKAKEQIVYMLDLTSAEQNYKVRLYAPYYRGFTEWDVWAQAIDDIIEDEIDRETLKSQFELAKHHLIEFVGSEGSIAEFRFTKLGYQVAKYLKDGDENETR